MPRCTEAALDLNARLFESWGRVVGSPVGATVSLICGLILLSVLTAGMHKLEYFKDLDDIWIEEGTRAERENTFFDESFGGISRIGQYMITLKNGSNVLSPKSVRALVNTTQELFINKGAPASFITETFTKDDGSSVDLNFDITDFCERAPVPKSFKAYPAPPFQFSDPRLIGAWLVAGAFDSGMWQFMTHCLKEKSRAALLRSNLTDFDMKEMMQVQIWLQTNFAGLRLEADDATKSALIDAGLPGLDPGFGLNQLPCRRGTLADCYSEGEFDLPSELADLQQYGYALTMMSSSAFFPAQVFGSSTLFFDQCTTQAQQTIQGILTATGRPNPAVQAATLVGAFKTATGLPFAQSNGYWWRPSVDDHADDFSDHTFQAISNAAVPSSTQPCVVSGALRIASRTHTLPNQAPFYAVVPKPFNGGCCVLSVAGTVSAEAIWLGKRELGGAFAHRIATSAIASKSFILGDRLREERFTPNDITLTDSELLTVQRRLVETWERQQIEYLLDRYNGESGTGFGEGEEFEEFQVLMLLEQSITDLLSDAANVSPALILIGYIVMILNSVGVFLVFTCSKEFFIYSRPFMSFLGMASVGFSTAASFGVLAWGNMKLSPLNSALVPFMSMGLGIDDMFVLLQEFIRAAHLQDQPRLRIATTVREAGPSVTVTLVANAVAFMIASIVRLPAIYIFSYQMAAAMVLNWFGLFTVWLPLLYLNAIRSAQRKAFCCTTEKSESDVAKSSVMFEHYIDKYVAPVFTNVFFKIFALAAFFGCTSGLTYVGFTQTEYGLRLSDVALEGSYVRDTVRVQEDHFGGYPITLVTREINYTDASGDRVEFPQFQSNIQAILKDMLLDEFYDTTFPPASGYFYGSLLNFFNAAVAPAFNIPTPVTEIPAQFFYPTLRQFFASVGVTFLPSLSCRNQTSGRLVTCQNVDGEEIVIVATQGSGYVQGILTDDDYTDAIRSIRDTADSSGGNFDGCCSAQTNGTEFDVPQIFYGGSLFKFWEQYVNIEKTFYKTIGFCLLGVFVATLLFQFSPFSSILVGLMLLCTVLQLYGFMSMIGVKLNGFSVTNLAIAVGMSVEFTAHMSYAFLRANKFYQSRDDRMVQAMKETLQPMLAGAISSLISVICLAFAKYPFFRQYYFYMVALMTALAFVNGQIFLPIILSLIGPAGLTYDPAMSTAIADAKIVEDKIPPARSHSGKLADQQL